MAGAASLDSTHPYTLRGVTQMLGLTRHAVGRLVELGFVQPVRAGRALRFSFRDVVLLRAAQELRAADIPTRQILRSMRQLKRALPLDTPASAIRIRAVGDRIAVRWGDAQWDADTGQLMMDFHAAPGAAVHAFDKPAAPRDTQPAGEEDAQALYERAEALEASDAPAAEALYRRVLEAAPGHADAYANLGFMLSESGRHAQAIELYGRALQHCPQSALLHYNLGVALEAMGHGAEAVRAYEACLRLAPDMADAHQNAALLYAQAGDKQRAIRHFSAYRRLQPRR